MRRLRLYFAILFILLQLGTLCLFVYSNERFHVEDRKIWEWMSRRVYFGFNASLDDFIEQEQNRSFVEYRYLLFNPSGNQASSFSRSPLSENIDQNTEHGLVGYFQIDPDGSFSTPYLPKTGDLSFVPDLADRRARQDRLIALTRRFFETLSRMPEHKASLGSSRVSEDYSENLLQPEKNKTKLLDKDLPVNAELIAKDKKQIDANPNRAQKKAFSGPEQVFLDQEVWMNFKNPTKKPAPLFGKKSEQASPRDSKVWVDPLTVELQPDGYLIFYRKVWADQELYFQGFVVEIDRFFRSFLKESFEASPLYDFAIGKIEWNRIRLFTYGKQDPALPDPILFFEQSLVYPLNDLVFQLCAATVPKISSRSTFYLLSLLLFCSTTGGFFLLYRTVRGQIFLAQKKQDFVSAVTHELRTPLASIRLYSEMLEQNWVEDFEKQKQYSAQIACESARLGRLIDQVLELSRLEKQAQQLLLQKKDPKEDLEKIVGKLTAIAVSQGFSLVFEAPQNLPQVFYDSDLLEQILLCFLDNSLKFVKNNQDLLLELVVHLMDQYLVIDWKDRGPGIPKSELKKVFNQFYRVENELTRQTKGTGIGLAIAQGFAETMKGVLEALGREGGGLIIRLKLPV